MTTKKTRTLQVVTTSYKTDDIWAVVNSTDEIIAVGIGAYKTKAKFVQGYETLEDDAEDVDEQFDKLLEEMPGTKLIQVDCRYTVERKNNE